MLAGISDIGTVNAPAMSSKIVVASTFGTIIEWYDFFIYGIAAATIFGKTFFPSSDPVISALAAFGVFAVGYIARPLGGILFGHFGDRIGRRSMLILSMMLMGGRNIPGRHFADLCRDRSPGSHLSRAPSDRSGDRDRW